MKYDNSFPLVSIIIPVYNVEAYLEECLNSILNQTFQNLEIILIDDGSSDKSGEICDKYALIDFRIIVVHKKNGGAASARNAGLDICKGDYISFVDSDDIVSPFFVEILYECITHNDCDVSTLEYGLDFKNKEDKILQLLSNDKYNIREISPYEAARLMLYQKIPMGPPWRLCKRKIFDGLRFPTEFLYDEDISVSYKIYFRATKVAVVDARLYGYRKHCESTMQMKFSDKKLSCIPISEQMIEDIMKYDSNLIAAGYSRAFVINYQVFLEIPLVNKQALRKVWKKIVEYRKYILKNCDKDMKRKNKLGAYCTFGGMYFSNLCGKFISKKIKF